MIWNGEVDVFAIGGVDA